MNINETISALQSQFEVLDTYHLDHLSGDIETFALEVKTFCQRVYKPVYQDNQRLVFVLTHEFYDQKLPLRLSTLQRVLNEIDISNFFVVVVTTNPEWQADINVVNGASKDPVKMSVNFAQGKFQRSTGTKSPYHDYRYGSPEPVQISLQDLTAIEKHLLLDSKTFCIYPWIHLHAYPTGEVYPCCHAEMGVGQVGNCKTHTLAEIWQGQDMQKLRSDMLSETPNAACTRCYEQEASGFFSGRRSANKHHGHHIKKLHDNPFEMTYWDIRFSNLCNLRCRSCGHIFSSQWYQDQAALAGPEWRKTHQVLNYAGRTETDIWEQLLPHIDYVEQIYFAGGEPLLMEEHYRILDELERRGRFDVRLIYNTNFTHTDLKGRSVFDYWRRFDSVAVGASLDAMGPRAEYIRKGTDWARVEANRREMQEICPEVDFYISPTLSIMNAWHLPDFHRSWVDQGFIQAQDLNVNILQDPRYYRIDVLPAASKQRVAEKFQQHLQWLAPLDPLQRATVGFQSAVTYMMANDNSHLLPEFWNRTQQLDQLRRESARDVIPELSELA
jgi:radical SAM protein with 4Fe4S-binding SPASM domain